MIDILAWLRRLFAVEQVTERNLASNGEPNNMSFVIDLNVNINHGAEAPPWVAELKSMLGLIITKENQIMSIESDALDQAEASAAANSAAADSAEALLVTLSQMVSSLTNNQTDPATAARITALSASINDRAARLGAAVAANTPAAPAEPVVV